MQTVEGTAAAPVGGFADHDVVVAVVLGDKRAVAVLAMEDRVVGGGLLEAVLVEDRDVGIEDLVAEPQAVDLDAEPLALAHGHLVVIDVLGEDDAFDCAVELDGLGTGKIVVGLLLVHVRERADEELACVGESGLRAHADEVVAEGDLWADGEGQLDLAGRDALHALHPEARGVEEQVLEIGETRPGERHLDLGAALPAIGLGAREIRVRRPRDREGQQERREESDEHDARTADGGLRRASRS